jgi:hypothetical protein
VDRQPGPSWRARAHLRRRWPQKVENDNDPKIIGESQQYLRDFSAIVAEETTAAGIVARMVERYADWGNLRTLWYSAKTAIARKDTKMTNTLTQFTITEPAPVGE